MQKTIPARPLDELSAVTAPSDATPTSRFVQLLLLATAACATVYARFTLAPLQETMRLNLGLTDHQIAWIQGPAIAVPLALGAIPLGLILDRYSRARFFLIFAALNLLACALPAFASGFALLFFARCLLGIAQAGLFVAAYSMVADLYAPERRGRATMVVSMGEISGAPAAFALGGIVLVSATATAGGEAWRSALLWMCLPLVPATLLMAAVREPPRTGVVVKNPPLREVWPEFWSYRAMVVPMLLARIMVWIAAGATLVWAAPTFERHFALTPDRVGAIIAGALLFSGIAGPALGGPLADLCQRSGGPRRTMTVLVVLAMLSVPVALFAIMPSGALAGVALAVFLAVGFTIGTMELALAMIVIPGELRALYIAITATVGALFADGLAPLVVSGLSSMLGGEAMIGKALATVCAVMSVLGTIVFAFGRTNFPGKRPADSGVDELKRHAGR